MCVVCLLSPPSVVFTSCGHCVTCDVCTPEALYFKRACPVCRAPVSASRGWLPLRGAHSHDKKSESCYKPDAVAEALRADQELSLWKGQLERALCDVVPGLRSEAGAPVCVPDAGVSLPQQIHFGLPSLPSWVAAHADSFPDLTLAVVPRRAGGSSSTDAGHTLCLPFSHSSVEHLRRACCLVPDEHDDRGIDESSQLQAHPRLEDSGLDVILSGSGWEALVTQASAVACSVLEVEVACVSARLHRIRLDEPGGLSMVLHEKEWANEQLLATMLLQLPVESGYNVTGGHLVVRHTGSRATARFSDAERVDNNTIITATAFLPTVEHQFTPVTRGARVNIVYSLIAPRANSQVLARTASARSSDLSSAPFDCLVTSLSAWPWRWQSRLVLPLSHAYTRDSLRFNTLVAEDEVLARTLLFEGTPSTLLEGALVLVDNESENRAADDWINNEVVSGALWIGMDNAALVPQPRLSRSLDQLQNMKCHFAGGPRASLRTPAHVPQVDATACLVVWPRTGGAVVRACDHQPCVALALAAVRARTERDDAGECLAAAVNAAQSGGWCQMDSTTESERGHNHRALALAAKLLSRTTVNDADQDAAAVAASKVISRMKTEVGWPSTMFDCFDAMDVLSDILAVPEVSRGEGVNLPASNGLRISLDECLHLAASACTLSTLLHFVSCLLARKLQSQADYVATLILAARGHRVGAPLDESDPAQHYPEPTTQLAKLLLTEAVEESKLRLATRPPTSW